MVYLPQLGRSCITRTVNCSRKQIEWCNLRRVPSGMLRFKPRSLKRTKRFEKGTRRKLCNNNITINKVVPKFRVVTFFSTLNLTDQMEKGWASRYWIVYRVSNDGPWIVSPTTVVCSSAKNDRIVVPFHPISMVNKIGFSVFLQTFTKQKQ